MICWHSVMTRNKVGFVENRKQREPNMSTEKPADISPEDAAAQKKFAKAQQDAKKQYGTAVRAAKVARDLAIARACIAMNEAMTPPDDDK